MDDDLNTPKAISVLFDLSKEINKAKLEGKDIKSGQNLLKELASILGIDLENEQKIENEIEIDKVFIEELIQKRNDFREKKMFKEADSTRDELNRLGIEISDSKDGTVWKKIS